MLEIRNVHVSVDNGLFVSKKKEILSDISFSLPDGETLGIVGKSGSGKTSIANAICGLVRCRSGEILIDGKSAHKEYSRLELAKKVQLVTQNPETSFDPDLSISDSFTEVLKIHSLPAKGNALENKVRPLLRDVGLAEANLNKPPKHFSGGELQRLSLVKALLVSPKTIIFDEADSMLDTAIRIKLFDTINLLRQKYGLSYIYITHDIRVLPHLVKNVLVICSGKAMEYGSVKLLRTSMEPFIKSLRDSLVMELRIQNDFQKGLVIK